MDKSARNFLLLSSVITAFFIVATAFIILIYRFSTLETYNVILFLLACILAAVTVFFLAAALTVLQVYRKKTVKGAFFYPAKTAIRAILPLVLMLSGFVGKNKESLRRFYIDINNILVDSSNKKYTPDRVMLLLPHCLQNSECGIKVTNNINNCKECGKCCISDILKLSREYGVEARIVTGGTAARNAIGKDKPDIVLSVACERDLSLGIADVGSLPVIGVINERPNGPCVNTTVNVGRLKDKLEQITGNR